MWLWWWMGGGFNPITFSGVTWPLPSIYTSMYHSCTVTQIIWKYVKTTVCLRSLYRDSGSQFSAVQLWTRNGPQTVQIRMCELYKATAALIRVATLIIFLDDHSGAVQWTVYRDAGESEILRMAWNYFLNNSAGTKCNWVANESIQSNYSLFNYNWIVIVLIWRKMFSLCWLVCVFGGAILAMRARNSEGKKWSRQVTSTLDDIIISRWK